MTNVLTFVAKSRSNRVQGPTGASRLDYETLLDMELEGALDPFQASGEVVSFRDFVKEKT